MARVALGLFLAWMVSAIAQGASPDTGPDTGPGTKATETVAQAFTAAMRQSIGAPARADIGDQATVRLADTLVVVPQAPAARLLAAMNRPVPADFEAVLMGPEAVDTPGIVRFVPTGFIDANAALGWSPEDMLASLDDTVKQGNPARVKNNQPEREARRWVLPPSYNPETHQLSWAALIVPTGSPRETDGEITYHAIGFGREGYVELTVVTSVQKANDVGVMGDNFLRGLNFRPGKTYAEALPTDPRSAAGLAGPMEIDSLHNVRVGDSFWGSDAIVPAAGGTVATIGALALLIYVRRHLRREARRG